MTLIFSHVSPETGLFTASDIIVSKPADMQAGKLSIPFRDQPLELSNAGCTPANLMQKSISFGRTLITFAGSVLVAHTVISKVRELSIDGKNEIDIVEVVEGLGLNDNEKSSVSLIYHYSPDEPWIIQTAYGCEEKEVAEGTSIYVAGSGSWYFFDNLRGYEGRELPPAEHILAQFLTRMASHPILESTSTDTLEHLYGGWFELSYRDGSQFRKVPYAVRFWARGGGVLSTGGPIYFGWYKDHGLTITRMQLRERDGRRDLDCSHQYVRDPLRRSQPGPPDTIIRPFFVMHIVFDSDHAGVVSTLIDHDIDGENMLLEIGPDGVRFNWKAHLITKLLSIGNNGTEPQEATRFT